jgi:adenylate cyclase
VLVKWEKIRVLGDTLDGNVKAPNADRRSGKLAEAARRTDSRPALVASAKLVRRILPGDEHYGDVLSTAGEGLPQHLGRLVAELRSERPSAVRELGLGALQAWQALSEVQHRGRGTVDVAILFTDLVGFSSWALEAGDDAALELLRLVGAAEEGTVCDHGGIVVKRLGDGAMAVFQHPEQAVRAVLELQRTLAGITVQGHTPLVRAGVHVGRPRRIGRDYLGVDVNVAARIVAAAGPGEMLASETACRQMDSSAFTFGRLRRLEAPGAPTELAVCQVMASAGGA